MNPEDWIGEVTPRERLGMPPNLPEQDEGDEMENE